MAWNVRWGASAILCAAVLSSTTGHAQFEAPSTVVIAPVVTDGAHWLTVPNIVLAAFKLEPTDDRLARAERWLQIREPQRYASNMHDTASLQAEDAVKADELDAELAALATPLRYTLDLQATVVEVRDGHARIESVLSAAEYAMPTDFGSSAPEFPPVYEFALGNHGELDWFALQQGRAAELSALIADSGPQPAYIRVELELTALSNHRRFETRIHQIDWYADHGRSHLIASRVDGQPGS